jgi:hypothetical protein
VGQAVLPVERLLACREQELLSALHALDALVFRARHRAVRRHCQIGPRALSQDDKAPAAHRCRGTSDVETGEPVRLMEELGRLRMLTN